MDHEDNLLAARAKQGDRLAFSQLVERHYGLMFRVSYRFTGNAQDAGDVAQDVCIGLAHKLASFRGESKFSTWLYTVVVNSCRDFHKKERSARGREKNYVEAEKHVSAEQAEQSKKAAWLYRSIARLQPDLRETALLVIAEELSHAETGNILGCAESTVSWRMHEIRKQLKAMMDSYHG